MPEILLKEKLLGEFKGILFDKDGTISYSEIYLTKTAISRIKEAIKRLRTDLDKKELNKFRELLTAAYGITSLGLDPHGSVAIASRSDNLISTATIICLIGKSWSESIDLANQIFLSVDKDNEYNQINPNLKTLIPGVKQLLDNFTAKSIKCALISNDTNEGIEDFLKENDLKKYFEEIWSCESKPAKPNPEAVKELCKTMKLHPSECLLIGDSDSDLKMAQEAGIGLALGYISGWKIKPNLLYQNELIFNWDELSSR